MKVGDTFESFEEFKLAKTKYERQSSAYYTVYRSNSIQRYNAECKKFTRSLKLKYATATLGCKHYGDKRTTGKGDRKNQL
jgi:hypothetical protein